MSDDSSSLGGFIPRADFPTEKFAAKVTNFNLNNLKFVDLLGTDDISYLKHDLLPSDTLLPSEGQIQKSIIINESSSLESVYTYKEESKEHDSLSLSSGN